MNLPFSPMFYRKVALFQELMEYENQGKIKELWQAEKAALYWAAGKHHQHLGQSIDWKNIKDALSIWVADGYMTAKTQGDYDGQRYQVLKNLEIHEFAKKSDVKKTGYWVIINKDGILAGEIIRETKNLKNLWKYKLWVMDWYLLYYAAGLLLVVQAVKALFEVFTPLKSFLDKLIY